MLVRTGELLAVNVEVEVFGKVYHVEIPTLSGINEDLLQDVFEDVEVSWIESSDEWVINLGEHIIEDGFESEEDADDSFEDIVEEKMLDEHEIIGFEIVHNPLNFDNDEVEDSTLEDMENWVDEINDSDVDIDDVRAVMNCGGYGAYESWEMVYNDNVIIRGGIFSEEQFAEEFVSEIGSWAGVEFGRNSNIEMYLDYEKIASELFMGDFCHDDETNRVVEFNV